MAIKPSIWSGVKGILVQSRWALAVLLSPRTPLVGSAPQPVSPNPKTTIITPRNTLLNTVCPFWNERSKEKKIPPDSRRHTFTFPNLASPGQHSAPPQDLAPSPCRSCNSWLVIGHEDRVLNHKARSVAESGGGSRMAPADQPQFRASRPV